MIQFESKKLNIIVSAYLIISVIPFLFSGSLIGAEKMPEFRLQDVNGNPVELKNILGTGPVLIDFFATWCKPCREEMPRLHDLYLKYKEKGFIMVVVAIDNVRTVSQVKQYVQSNKFTFQVLLDTDMELAKKLNVVQIPHILVLDKLGNIVHSHIGYIPGGEKAVEEQLLKLLETGAGK
jgi:peroxiredoxin